MKYAVVGVAMKVTMMTGMVCIGLGQGVQPLLGYCVGAKNWERYRSALKFSLIFAFILSTVLTLICYLFTGQIVSVFRSPYIISQSPEPWHRQPGISQMNEIIRARLPFSSFMGEFSRRLVGANIILR